MTHIRYYLERKGNQLKHIFHRYYEHPTIIMWMFTVIAIGFGFSHLYLQTIISLGFAIFYWIYCDYKTGEDIGWKRQQWKDKAKAQAENS